MDANSRMPNCEAPKAFVGRGCIIGRNIFGVICAKQIFFTFDSGLTFLHGNPLKLG